MNGVASWFEKAEIKQIAAMNNNLHKNKNNKMIVKPLTTLRYVRKQQGVNKEADDAMCGLTTFLATELLEFSHTSFIMT